MMDQEGDGSEFGKQFAGSAAANVVFMIGLLLYKFFESRFKHSKCSSNTGCFKCNVDNYETERSTRNKAKDAIQSEESVPELQAREHQEIQERHPQIIEVMEPESTDNSRTEFSLVRGGELV
mgnify:CR=1 FL=1